MWRRISGLLLLGTLASPGVSQASEPGTLLLQADVAGQICASREVALHWATPVQQDLACFGRALRVTTWAQIFPGTPAGTALTMKVRLSTPLAQHNVLTPSGWVRFSDVRVVFTSKTVVLRPGAATTLHLADHVGLRVAIQDLGP